MLANNRQLAALVKLFHTGTRQEYSKGEFIVRPGSLPQGVFYIESGLIKAYDITKYGEENLLILRKGGEVIGLTWAITGRDREIIYTALAPTTTWLVPRDAFITHLRNNPEIAVPIVSMLAEMYREHSERIISLEYRTVRERLASFLISTASRFGEQTAYGVAIRVPLRHQDIASSISATRETTSRTLSELDHKEIIHNEQGNIIIYDLEALKSIIE